MTPFRDQARFACCIALGSLLERPSSENQPRSSSCRTSGKRSTMLTGGASLVDPGLLDLPADLGEVAPVLAPVVPPPLNPLHAELAAVDELAVDVGDLELAAARRLQRVDDL